jgi:hypothetical protein
VVGVRVIKDSADEDAMTARLPSDDGWRGVEERVHLLLDLLRYTHVFLLSERVRDAMKTP